MSYIVLYCITNNNSTNEQENLPNLTPVHYDTAQSNYLEDKADAVIATGQHVACARNTPLDKR